MAAHAQAASGDLIANLRQLGLIAQVSSEDQLTEHLQSGRRSVYCGFDPTADSLHVGNLVPLLALRRFQMAGHRPILLVGGATGMIGDPGGRTEERQLNSADVVEAYVDAIRPQASRFLDFDDPDCAAIVVNNADWTRDLAAIDFLRDVGKHFSVNAMVQKESVRRRLEDESSGISYTEFSYMILQSYDFAVLNERYDCTVQLGGSDQWGNITSGIDLVRRMHGAQAFAVTFPLVTKADGTKFGKSEGDAVWLDPAQTSPYAFYQFWLNSADEDVAGYLNTFTFLPLETLAELRAAHAQDPGSRSAQIALAREVTRLVHGEEGLTAAERITEAIFRNRLAELAESDLAQLAIDGLPSSSVAPGTPLMELLVTSGLAVTPRGEVTQGQARKLITGNGVSVNGEKVTDTEATLGREGALFGRYHIVQKGKKNHHLVVLGDG